MQIFKFHDKKLFEAVKSGQMVPVTSALASGANPDLIDPATHMPLLHFCANSKRFDIMRALLGSSADFLAKDREGRSLMRRCVEDGLTEGVKILIGHGIDLRETDSVGDSLLHSACARGRKSSAYFEIAKILIDSGALLGAKNHRGEIPMHHAARYAGDRLARYMASRSDLNSADLDGHAPLHAAVLGIDNEEGVRALIDAKAEVNFKDRNGQTPLHLIAGKPKTRPTDIIIAKFLIYSGASLWPRDRDYCTPYDIAKAAFTQRREVHQELVDLLRPKGNEPPPPDPQEKNNVGVSKGKSGGKR